MQIRYRPSFLLVSVVLTALSCGPTSNEEIFVYQELAEITAFSVPDSASAASIPVTISAILGKTTASSLEAIVWERNDSLFQFAIYAKRLDKFGEQYQTKDITLDTTLTLTTNPPRFGLHFFRIVSSTGIALLDSTRLY